MDLVFFDKTNRLEFQCPSVHQSKSHAQRPFHELVLQPSRHIHKLPDELLSSIFIYHCQDDWNGPFTLTAVCYRWRQVMFSTARAWTFSDSLPFDRLLTSNQMNFRISHLGALTTCFNLRPYTQPAALDAIFTHTANIRCLTLFENAVYLLNTFPELEELRLGNSTLCTTLAVRRHRNQVGFLRTEFIEVQDEWLQKCLLDVTRFPKLHSLHLHSPDINSMRLISVASGFPPLQHLHIHNYSTHWRKIIENCAASLVTLGVDLVHEDVVYGNPIFLPRLKHLSIVIDGIAQITGLVRPPRLITPLLDSYHEVSSARWASPVHQDLNSVTDIIIFPAGRIDWTRFPNLITLGVTATCQLIEEICEELGNNTSLCPRISQVDFTAWDEAMDRKLNRSDARQALRRRIAQTTFQGSEQEFDCLYSECYTHCTCSMSHNNPYGEDISSIQ